MTVSAGVKGAIGLRPVRMQAWWLATFSKWPSGKQLSPSDNIIYYINLFLR